MAESDNLSRSDSGRSNTGSTRPGSRSSLQLIQNALGRQHDHHSNGSHSFHHIMRMTGSLIPVAGFSIEVSSANALALTPLPPLPHYPELGPTDDTRLVRIHPAISEDEGLVCTSEPVALHDEPHYVALSHSWGPSKPQRDIVLNGHTFPIRLPLYEALLALRRKGVERVWVDKMSINQKDHRERERQLHKVRVIFSHAAVVIAWIGLRFQDESDRRMDAEAGLEFLGRRDFPQGNWSPNEIMSVQAVARREYWTRCWIIQELCVARHATVLCGSTQVEFEIFWNNIKVFLAKTALGLFPEDVQRHLISLKDFQAQESAKSRLPRMSLVKAILQSRHSKCYSRYDKIFAILSLAHDGNQLVDTPNYRQRIETIFWKLAHNMIHLQGHIAIILLARRVSQPTHDSPPATLPITASGTTRTERRISVKDVDDFNSSKLPLPSWTPYWSALGDQHLPKWIEESVEMDMDDKKTAPVETLHEGKYGTVLRIRGVPLESIDSTSGIPGITKFNATEPGMRRIGLTPPSSHAVVRHGQPSSRQNLSTKRFAGPLDVIEKLWDAIIAPVYHGSGDGKLPHPIHECANADCRSINVRGVAVARVLLESIASDANPIDSTDRARREIRDWMEINQNLMIGNRDLKFWLSSHLISSNVNPCGRDPRRYRRNTAPRTPPCSFDKEVLLLAQAFAVMRENSMKLVVTSRATIKVAFCEARIGDWICRLDRVSLPVVLRPIPADASDMSDFHGPHAAPASSRDPSPTPKPIMTQESTSDTMLESMTESIYLDASETASTEGTHTYRFVGDVFLHDHGASDDYAFLDQQLTGWKERHFASDRWVFLRIV